MADPAVNGALLQVARESADESLRLRAIALLAERRAVETVNDLLALAGKDAPAVRTEATSALRTLAPGEMLNELLLFASMPTLGEVASVLPQALAEVAKRRVDAGDSATPVADMLHQVTDARAKPGTEQRGRRCAPGKHSRLSEQTRPFQKPVRS